ncbi:glycoside hydrolase family 2 TIM barrel-domain containing protein [Rufibacter quisquiliarum]|uniref:Beta-galactosidase n=1 Tax=Rufibacter quisquiliarum TaxID=1549639 RepID=A0A839GUS6_9BACT|nr:glycoside hydrolase family 2 TIM barrel-domain containing protein [Rufibacter quisquiliarum]MBA9078637.1 beta-galactosidase [Rufibacter quisquiliarum]
MKFLQLIFSCFVLFCFWGTSPARAAQPGATGTQKTIDFDFDWRFHLGEVPAAKEKTFDDRQWRKVDVPHDFSIEQDFDLNHPSGWSGAYLPGGIGWYRKTFDWKPAKDQKVFVQFDGVYMNSDVWVNGHHLGKRPYGYISFQYDLSPYLINGQNVIAVRADNSKLPSSRWYTGSGIYRHVRLAVTQNVFIPTWGTFISTPQVTKDQALVQLQIDLENASGQPTKLTLLTDILEPSGKKVTQVSQQLTLNPGQRTVTQKATISKPKFWSPEKPQRYKAVHRLQNGKQTLQEYTTYFGVRTVEVNAKDGFVLNGQKMKLNGVCNHHDGGPVGSAVPEDVLYRRLKLLKEMGCNAIRTSHNPAAPEFYTMADTMGFLVLDEAFDGWDKPKAKYDYGHYFKDWWQKDLADFIKRDRNHPSVVMWSIGNEVPEFEPERQRELVEALKKLDTTRPVTQARGSSSPYIDIPGFNGEGEMPETLEKFHQKHPDKPLLGTEITHSLQTRGVYASKTSYRTRDFPAPWEDGVKWENFKSKVFMIPDLTQEEVFQNNSKFYQSSYDNAIVRIGVRDQHKRTESLDYLIGTFRWTGFDYLGEATIQPARTANFGILDLAGFPKDHYYLYQSLWSKKPMVHLLPHWTHPGKEGVAIPVVAYTNAETVELFLNGKSLGEQKMPEDLQIVWQVPYQAGTLKAIARKGGKVVAETSVSTAGAASNIRVTPDKKQARANKRDVIHMEVDITDTQGNLAPEADNLVKFTLTGPGKIIGVENGDIIDFASMKIPQRKAFKGKCLVMVQTTDKPGEIVLKANADGLKSGEVKVQVK